MRLVALSITFAVLVTLAAIAQPARAAPPADDSARARMAPTWMVPTLGVPTLGAPPEMVAGPDLPREPEDSEPSGRMSLLEAPASGN